MPDLIRFSCPSCGGKLESTEMANQFGCGNCGNIYSAQQKGSQISLVPLAQQKDGAVVVGNSNVIVQVNSGTPGRQTEAAATPSQAPVAPVEKVECPLCGKRVSIDNVFHCRECGREHLCLEHQDKNSFLCNECTKRLKYKNAGKLSFSLGFIALLFALATSLGFLLDREGYEDLFINFIDPRYLYWLLLLIPAIPLSFTALFFGVKAGKIHQRLGKPSLFISIIAITIIILIILILGFALMGLGK
jgi:hypothetical protein